MENNSWSLEELCDLTNMCHRCYATRLMAMNILR